MCEVLIGQRLQLHQGQSCDRCSGGGGTLDGGSDLLLGHCLHSFNGGSHLLEVNDVVVTGVRTNVVEGSEGLVLGQHLPLNHAVESVEAFCSIDSTALVLVDSAEDLLRSPVLNTLWLVTAVGRRHWEFLMAVFSAMFVSLMEMFESFHGMLCLGEVKLVRNAILVKIGVLTKEVVHEDSLFLFHEAPLNHAVESLEALLSVDGSVLVLVNVTKDLLIGSVVKFLLGRAFTALGRREWEVIATIVVTVVTVATVVTVVIVIVATVAVATVEVGTVAVATVAVATVAAGTVAVGTVHVSTVSAGTVASGTVSTVHRGRAFGSVLFELHGSGADGEKSSSEEFHRYFWVGCFLLLIFTKIAFLLYPSIRVAVIFLVTFAF